MDKDKGEKYCVEHRSRQFADRERRSVPFGNVEHEWNDMYNDEKWRALRRGKLKADPLCEICGMEATEVHHKVPHNGNWSLFLDWDNLMSICHECHMRETQRETREKLRRNHEEAKKRKARGHIWY